MDPRITTLTSNQLGLVTRSQLKALGIERAAVRHLVDSGHLIQVTPRVLLLSGVPVTDLTRCLCGVLDADAALSHHSSAALWGAPGYRLSPVHVTRLRGGRVRPGHLAVVHEPRQLLEEHITTYRGIRVLRPHRLLFDLAAVEPPGRVERSLDWMWSRRLVTIPRLDRTLEQVAVRGRSGVALMRSLIEERRGLPAPGSNLERRFEEIVRRALLPPFERQVDVGDHVDWIGRVDFRSTTRKLVIEIDSELHHAALSDRRLRRRPPSAAHRRRLHGAVAGRGRPLPRGTPDRRRAPALVRRSPSLTPRRKIVLAVVLVAMATRTTARTRKRTGGG